MLRRLAGALVFIAGAVLVSGCLLDFGLPDDYVSTDPAKGCQNGGKCKFDCGSGTCSSTCGEGSECYVDCGSGLCASTCEKGAECTIDCGSGSCQIACEGKCTILKGSGDIQCSGPGCP